jgi:ethanolaminephosphotransferase
MHQKSDCQSLSDETDEIACLWARVVSSKGEEEEKDSLSQFLYKTQDALSSTASSYDVPRMVAGVALAFASSVLAVLAFPSFWPPSLAGSALTLTTILYGVMMFATSYVEEEQHFWYWITPAWLAFFAIRSLQHGHRLHLAEDWNLPSAILTIPVLACHRLMVRWNQTGQKHAGEPDIVHEFFPSHHVLMWILILATYLVVGYQLARTCLRSTLIGDADLAIAFVSILPAVVFKLNFTQADAPELVLGLGGKLRAVTADLDLLTQARVVFVMLTLCLIIAVVEAKWNRKKQGSRSKCLAEHLLASTMLTNT